MAEIKDDFDPIEAEIDAFIARISEHFDSVRIFTTARADNGNGDSYSYTNARGNIHAQRGQIRAWVIRQEEIEREDVRKPKGDE